MPNSAYSTSLSDTLTGGGITTTKPNRHLSDAVVLQQGLQANSSRTALDQGVELGLARRQRLGLLRT